MKGNEMTNEQMLVVIQAEIDGKEIEMQLSNVPSDPWRPKPQAYMWDFVSYRYRVKPELIVEYKNFYGGYSHKTRQQADQMGGDSRTACVRVEYTEGQFDA